MKIPKTPKFKLQAFAKHIPAWGWWEWLSIEFASKEEADTYLKVNDLLGYGFEFRVVKG
jgi:hypothetical protein